MTPALGERVATIEARNRRVEAEKAWEGSWMRVGSITLGTYVAASLLLWMIDVPNPYLGAFVPALGFLLSTQSLPALKRWWIRQQ